MSDQNLRVSTYRTIIYQSDYNIITSQNMKAGTTFSGIALCQKIVETSGGAGEEVCSAS
jgi:hypothetical protein